jgi:uncharacterized protein involved in response to NO
LTALKATPADRAIVANLARPPDDPMLKVFAEPTRPQIPPVPHPVLALGFRPFFLLAALTAVASMLLWLAMWDQGTSLDNGYGLVEWHTHEMLFGYGAAVVAGFLLTAVRNWTGANTLHGARLGALALLWLAGRLVPWLDSSGPRPVLAAVDLAFLPLLALALKRPLWAGRERVNRIFVPILGVTAGANLLFHLQFLGWAPTARRGTDAMLVMLVLLIALIGGRVIPFFTQTALPGFRARRFEWAERASLWVLGALALALAAWPSPWLVAPLAWLAAASQAVRLYGWHDHRIWPRPILWVLHTGFAWLILGLVLLALSASGLVAPAVARHALAVGGLGVVTLGMMARVSLGHTGRPLQPPRLVEASFVAVNLAAVLRVLGPLLAPEHHTLWLQSAGALWVLAFLVFLYHYLPMLLTARADGQPG